MKLATVRHSRPRVRASGKSVTARIGALREVREAHRVDYWGNRIAKLTVEGDTTSIAIRPHEMTFVDIDGRNLAKD